MSAAGVAGTMPPSSSRFATFGSAVTPMYPTRVACGSCAARSQRM